MTTWRPGSSSLPSRSEARQGPFSDTFICRELFQRSLADSGSHLLAPGVLAAIAELLGAQEGAGFLIKFYATAFVVNGMISLVVLLGLTAILFDRLVVLGATYLTRWSESGSEPRAVMLKRLRIRHEAGGNT